MMHAANEALPTGEAVGWVVGTIRTRYRFDPPGGFTKLHFHQAEQERQEELNGRSFFFSSSSQSKHKKCGSGIYSLLTLKCDKNKLCVLDFF